MTPTKAGEGKTTTLVGLTQGLGVIGKRPVACLREPSLGPVFGIKGGAAGGGMTQVVPMEDLNLHFTGDIHAIGAANNLLAAMLDASILHGNPLQDRRAARRLAARDGHERPRAAPDHRRARRPRQRLPARERLRHHRGLRGDGDHGRRARPAGPARAARARSPSRTRSTAARPITAEDLGAAGAMAVLLKDAIKPNLIQTLEGQPCLMHCGPFANIAHGNNSLVADLIGMKIGDYVVTESGFGSDMGMEKFFDIVCRFGGLTPSAVVLVTTVRAIKHHGGIEDDPRIDRAHGARRDRDRHGQRAPPPRPSSSSSACRAWSRSTAARATPTRRSSSSSASRSRPARSAPRPTRASPRAAIGAADLASRGRRRVRASRASSACSTRTTGRSRTRSRRSPRRVYGAADVYFYPEAEKKIGQYTRRRAWTSFPVCMAKTHLSLSSDPDAAQRAGELQPAGARHPRLHRRRLARAAVRRHHADAGPGQDARPRSTSTSTPNGRTVGLF